MELLSNCCGARVDGLNADNIGICSECKEGCGVEEVGRIEVSLTKEELSILFDIVNNAYISSPSTKIGIMRKVYDAINELDKLSEQKQ